MRVASVPECQFLVFFALQLTTFEFQASLREVQSRMPVKPQGPKVPHVGQHMQGHTTCTPSPSGDRECSPITLCV